MILSDQTLLVGRDGLEDYHVNPSLEEKENRIFIPCGWGSSDYGFFIYGIDKKNCFENRELNIYSLVYNYFLRNSHMSEKDIPLYLKARCTSTEVEYRSIFRLAMILLQMIKNGYMKDDTLLLYYEENRENLALALGLINDYVDRFSRLAKIKNRHLRIRVSSGGQRVSLRTETGIYAKDNTEFISDARELWFGRKINYVLKESDLADLEYLLQEISPFSHFREGQFEAICAMAQNRESSVCIMPTGSGKSLVFYFLSLLQPLPMFIVAPSDLLITDQIRNLEVFHRIDDSAHLKDLGEKTFLNFIPHNRFNYLTPTTLQNRDLLASFRHINNGTKMVGYREERIAPGTLACHIVLDEIHCISSWGHDFRPEYLMLSRYLNKYLDNIRFLGFTATASYAVVKDIQRQLSIPESNFISPISFEKYNVSYRYICCSDTAQMENNLLSLVREALGKNERTIIFTKSVQISRHLAELIGYQADYFSGETSTYYSFASLKSDILVTTEELGIGINFPKIQNVIHFGLPLSKNAYIQEIGRAGRANEQVTSCVLYLDATPENVPAVALQRNTKVEELPRLLSGYNNDYGLIFEKLTNHCPAKEQMVTRLCKFAQSFNFRKDPILVRFFPQKEEREAKELLYMLFCTGYIVDWYSHGAAKEEAGTNIMVDICSGNAQMYQSNPQKMMQRMRQVSSDFFENVAEDMRENVAKVNRAETAQELFEIYIDWYYHSFLYQHNEQFLDLYDFILSADTKDDEAVTNSIKDFFTLPFARLRDDEKYFNSLSLDQLADRITTGFAKDTLINAERILSNRYSVNPDILLLFGNLIQKGILDRARFSRVLSNINQENIEKIEGILLTVFGKCSLMGRIAILNYIEEPDARIAISPEEFFVKAYSSTEKDLLFYSKPIMAINDIFRRFAR